MLKRREFLSLAGLTAAAQVTPSRKYRAAVIGHTGHGNYGHDWDMTWNGLPGIEVVAVADPGEKGRKAAAIRSGARREYADYREMLAKEKPDLVAICPRWLDERMEMVLAAAEVRAHILVEKPFAASVADAARMIAAAARAGVTIQVGHPARPHPVTLQVAQLLKDGTLGELMEIRARGKEDRRAGGEDMMVLGTHCFDLMRMFGGDPEWVFAHVTDDGQEVRRGMSRKPTEPVGPVAGDSIAAMFRFAKGVHGYFDSRRSEVRSGTRFGITLGCSKGQVFMPLSAVPNDPALILRSSSWTLSKGGNWEVLAPPAGGPPDRAAMNRVMAADLIDAIEKGHEPVCSARDGLWTIEMVMGVYQSQFTGGRVMFPLLERRHPLV